MADVVQQAISLLNFVVVRVDYLLPPKGFTQSEEQHEVTVSHRLDFAKEGERVFIVYFTLKITDAEKSFRLNVEAMAWFNTKEPIDEAFKKSSMANLNAVAIGFPFLRSFVSTFSVSAGFPRVMLPTVNIHKLSKAVEASDDSPISPPQE